jgi:hypothetical protein
MAEHSPTAASRLMPTRNAARKASQNFADQLAYSPPQSDDEREPRPELFGEPSRRKGNTVRQYTSKSKALTSPKKPHNASKSAPAGAPQVLSLPALGKKRTLPESLSPLSDDDDESDPLTPLTTPRPSPVPSPARARPSTPKKTPKSRVIKGKPVSAPTTPAKPAPRTPKSKAQGWDLSQCASFVFVLVDALGEPIDEDPESHGGLVVWWPGKV